jgi:hypothetical protein
MFLEISAIFSGFYARWANHLSLARAFPLGWERLPCSRHGLSANILFDDSDQFRKFEVYFKPKISTGTQFKL